MQKVSIIWSPFLYFNFKSFFLPSFLPFLRLQCILHDWGVLFSEYWNFYKLKRRDLISGANQFWRKYVLFDPALLCLNFKSFVQPNSSSFIRFQCKLHEWRVLSSEDWDLFKLERGNLISGGNQFCRKSGLFGSRFCILVLKVLFTQIYRHSLDFNAFCMFNTTFLRVLKFLQIKEGGPNFWVEPILQKVWIIWSPLLYFNFKSFLDPNSSSFIRFQCILHDSGVLFSESWNFYKLKKGLPISAGNQFCRKSEFFDPPFCIWIVKVLYTQIHRHSLNFNAFCIIQEYFSQSIEISTN